jgi:PAS domain S-box-containing protein
MKLSLQRRIQLSFYLSIALVACIGVISFYYINQLNEQVQRIVNQDIELAHSSEKMKAALFALRRVERTFLIEPETPAFHESLQGAIEVLRTTVNNGHELSKREETKRAHQDILLWLDSYARVIKDTSVPINPKALHVMLNEWTNKIQDSVSSIINLRYADLEAHRKEAKILSEASNRNMILMIITTILAGVLLGFFAPSKVVLPFRKLMAAIQEVQSANLNVSVNIEGEDEIALLGQEFNTMVDKIRVFDDMKIKKIAFEKRKFDTLANMTTVGVIVLTVEGTVVYMNRQLYEILGLTSERILSANIADAPLPTELKSLFIEAIDRKDRFDGRQWKYTYKDESGHDVCHDICVGLSLVRNHVGDIVNLVITMKEVVANDELHHLEEPLSARSST